ncbi:MAG: hypothetical protein MK110_04735 [Fuerstiella sp.]|nr:hypothetical protein [Fuerstiella sp.]
MKRRQFIIGCVTGLLSVPLTGAASAPAAARKRRLISNHDGGILSVEPPITADHFRESVRSYAGTPVDAISWCVGDREVYNYDTKVGEVFGRGRATFENEGDWRVYKNTRRLIASGRCALATMVDVCRQESMDIFASVRMNSHYVTDPDSPHHSEFRRKHPEFLIGAPGGYSKGSREYGIRMGLNYAVPEVRQRMAATITELFTSFETDGVEMDFMRHPSFFKLHEAVENSYHMTNMLREIKSKRDEVRRVTGRSIELVARVPPTFADAMHVGLDVRTWIKEGLVDILIAGGGFIPFDMPFEDFVATARGTNCQIYGGMEFLRFRNAPTSDVEIERGIASRFWNAGADGLQLFNYFAQPTAWKKNLLNEIGHPDQLATLDKRFQMDTRRFNPPWNGHGAAFSTAIPAVQLPVTLLQTSTDKGPALHLHVADDLQSARENGTLVGTELGLYFDNLTSGDEIEVHLNGQRLKDGQRNQVDLISFWNKGQRKDGGRFLNGTVVFDSAPLVQGTNLLEVRLLKHPENLAVPLKLALVEAAVRYGTGRG